MIAKTYQDVIDSLSPKEDIARKKMEHIKSARHELSSTPDVSSIPSIPYGRK